MTEETSRWKEKLKTEVIDDVLQGIDILDRKSKLASEISGIVKGVISKDPKAIDGNAAEYFLKSHFGESLYSKIRKVYHDIIGAQ